MFKKSFETDLQKKIRTVCLASIYQDNLDFVNCRLFVAHPLI